MRPQSNAGGICDYNYRGDGGQTETKASQASSDNGDGNTDREPDIILVSMDWLSLGV